MPSLQQGNLLEELLADEENRKPDQLELPDDPDVKVERVGPRPDKYKYAMRNEPHQREEFGIDPETGWRFEWWDIGLVRNAKAENKTREKVFIDPIPHIIKSQHVPLRGWYENKVQPHAAMRPRPCFTEAILTQPYGGTCSVGCGFCYINQSVRGYRGQGVTVVDPEYPEKIKRNLAQMRTAAAVYMSSFIDPFLELEPHYENTKKVAAAVLAEGLPMFFLTRKVYPGWAYDFLKRNPYSYAQFSINTPSSDDWERLSPFASPLETQIQQVREMHKQGIYVSIQCNPIVAGITSNDQIVELIHTLADAGADHMIFKFVEMSHHSANALVDIMRKRFKGRADAFAGLFTQSIGGHRTIAQEYRIAAHQRFLKETKKAGITMGLCYEYAYGVDEFGGITNRTGVSIGKQFLTAAQCHGKRVPVHSRARPGDPWTPIPDCPPQGCLTCADSAPEGKVPCGNEKLGQASALTLADLRAPGWTRMHGAS